MYHSECFFVSVSNTIFRIHPIFHGNHFFGTIGTCKETGITQLLLYMFPYTTGDGYVYFSTLSLRFRCREDQNLDDAIQCKCIHNSRSVKNLHENYVIDMDSIVSMDIDLYDTCPPTIYYYLPAGSRGKECFLPVHCDHIDIKEFVVNIENVVPINEELHHNGFIQRGTMEYTYVFANENYKLLNFQRNEGLNLLRIKPEIYKLYHDALELIYTSSNKSASSSVLQYGDRTS